MKIVCAGCGQDLGDKPAENVGPDAVTHGVCEPCAIRFLAQVGISLPEYVESLSVPTVVVTAEGAVNSANASAMSLLDKDSTQIQGRPGGDVFECVHSMMPEGCGRTVHCSGCTIRNTVTDTWETGRTHSQVPAYLERSLEEGSAGLALLISTEKKGGLVFLRIEDIASA